MKQNHKKRIGTPEKKMVEELWREHQSSSFPAGCGGEEIEGIDLALLDADITGCVATFRKQQKLDLKGTAILGLCYRDCTVAISGLDGAAKNYFIRLEKLALLVLKAVIETEKA